VQPTAVEMEGVEVYLGETKVLHALSFRVEAGEIVSLLGPSGCGKTTLLRVIAGLLPPAAGEIRFDGRSVVRIPAERRGAVLVFQKPLLYPYLTVGQNIGFGLRMRQRPAEEIRQRVAEALAWVQLEGYQDRHPETLSGGQEQRVSLARALVTRPRVLLLDEPFSALDESLRGEMRLLLRTLHRALGMTTLFVTHDQQEAAMVGHRIGLLLDGQLAQIGSPRDFYTAPTRPDVARFFGWQIVPRANLLLAFRPERALVRQASSLDEVKARGSLILSGTLLAVWPLGLRYRYRIRLEDGSCIEAEPATPPLPSEPDVRLGEPIWLEVPSADLRTFPLA